MVRRFVIVGHNVDAAGDFSLNDLCGGAGRLDVLLRCVSSALFLSHGLRRNVEVHLVFPSGPRTVMFRASELKYANPDERSTGALVRNALLKKPKNGDELRASPGVYVQNRSFDDTLSSLPNPVWLAEDGESWDTLLCKSDTEITFVLSDHHDFNPGEEDALRRLNARKISLGPDSLHSNHCISVVHYLLDRQTP